MPFEVETDLRGMVRGTMEGTGCVFEKWRWGDVKAQYDRRIGSGHCQIEILTTLHVLWMEVERRLGTSMDKWKQDLRVIRREVWSVRLMGLSGLELPNELERECLEFVGFFIKY